MRETVRSLFDSSLAFSTTKQHRKPTIDSFLANLSPDGPPNSKPTELEAKKVEVVREAKATHEEVVLEVVPEPEPSPAVDTQILMEMMSKHHEEMAKLQSELRRIDVERSRAEGEAQAASSMLSDAEKRLKGLEVDLRDERTRFDVAMQRAQLMDQANSLPWWRFNLRKEFVRRAQALTMALPAR